jgi:hypothetical protein
MSEVKRYERHLRKYAFLYVVFAYLAISVNLELEAYQYHFVLWACCLPFLTYFIYLEWRK